MKASSLPQINESAVIVAASAAAAKRDGFVPCIGHDAQRERAPPGIWRQSSAPVILGRSGRCLASQSCRSFQRRYQRSPPFRCKTLNEIVNVKLLAESPVFVRLMAVTVWVIVRIAMVYVGPPLLLFFSSLFFCVQSRS